MQGRHLTLPALLVLQAWVGACAPPGVSAASQKADSQLQPLLQVKPCPAQVKTTPAYMDCAFYRSTPQNIARLLAAQQETTAKQRGQAWQVDVNTEAGIVYQISAVPGGVIAVTQNKETAFERLEGQLHQAYLNARQSGWKASTACQALKKTAGSGIQQCEVKTLNRRPAFFIVLSKASDSTLVPGRTYSYQPHDSDCTGGLLLKGNP